MKFEDTQFHFTGDLANLSSNRLVPGFDVSAGQLELRGDQTQVAIEGDGLFGDVPVTAVWQQPIDGKTAKRSTLTGQIELSPRLMRELNAGLPSGMLTGQGLAQFELGIGAGEPPRLTAQSDLRGVALAIPELGWRKAANRDGSLAAEATLGDELGVDSLRLDAAGFEHLPSQQIVLTGGGSQIPGLDGLASKILGQQVRLGQPLRVQGLPQAAAGPGFASAVGLSLFAAHPQDEWWDFELPVDTYPARSFKRVVRWFRDNW